MPSAMAEPSIDEQILGEVVWIQVLMLFWGLSIS